jgi:hypothetical protein
MGRGGRALVLGLVGSALVGCGRDTDDAVKSIIDRARHGDPGDGHGQPDAGPGQADGGCGAGTPDAGGGCGTAAPAEGWTQVPAPTTVDVFSAWTVAPGDTWFLASDATTTALHWNGTSIAASAAQPSGANIGSKIWAADASDVLVTGTRYNRWNGSAWVDITPAPDGGGRPIWGLGPDDVWTQFGGEVLHWDGTSWVDMHAPDAQFAFVSAFWGTSPNDVWVGGSYGGSWPVVYLWHWNGQAWSPGVAPASEQNSERGDISALWGFATNDIWAVGVGMPSQNWQPQIWHYDGTAWTHVATPSLSGTVTGVWGPCARDVWATVDLGIVNDNGVVSRPGALWHFDGNVWATVDLPYLPALRAVTGSSATDVWIAGAGGAVYHRAQ